MSWFPFKSRAVNCLCKCEFFFFFSISLQSGDSVWRPTRLWGKLLASQRRCKMCFTGHKSQRSLSKTPQSILSKKQRFVRSVTSSWGQTGSNVVSLFVLCATRHAHSAVSPCSSLVSPASCFLSVHPILEASLGWLNYICVSEMSNQINERLRLKTNSIYTTLKSKLWDWLI